MNFDLARHNMVVHQLERRGIHDPRVLEAMEWVPREEFVPPELLDLAYDDRALPIGLDQTISQPYTVAFMCQEARVTAGDKVLEIGTGSGYGAAVLSLLARELHTIERIEELFQAARERLARLSYDNVRVYLDDGTRGLAQEAPFNAIICTAGAEVLPDAYQQQLADGGRLVIPIGPPAHQQMVRLIRRGDKWDRDNLGSFGFVPL
ncbi:MAG TPA: protein-L-isoaspartate(D-aspartate) O-methyltransferase, partial [Lacipirellulaceae bacterium]|nr:protein-L-isoaspartate(D-aspartate) O-methyltransferase [Lacipirellulaceae bacterium]